MWVITGFGGIIALKRPCLPGAQCEAPAAAQDNARIRDPGSNKRENVLGELRQASRWGADVSCHDSMAPQCMGHEDT
jgi:hypothetical protein